MACAWQLGDVGVELLKHDAAHFAVGCRVAHEQGDLLRPIIQYWSELLAQGWLFWVLGGGWGGKGGSVSVHIA